MRLLPLDTPALIQTAAGWLAEESSYRWLDFGAGRQLITPMLLNIMRQRPMHELRIYTGDAGQPIGIVGLSDINNRLGTASLWGVCGEKSFRSRGYATLAGSAFLTMAFHELGLRAVHTWVVDRDPCRRLIERLNFHFVGRMRQCHSIGEQLCDRLCYDLLASEHRELKYKDVRGFVARRYRERMSQH